MAVEAAVATFKRTMCNGAAGSSPLAASPLGAMVMVGAAGAGIGSVGRGGCCGDERGVCGWTKVKLLGRGKQLGVTHQLEAPAAVGPSGSFPIPVWTDP